MEGTSGTPHLLTDVRFSVSRKGYDPDEVDNFLERVSAAVAQLQDKLRQATATSEAAEARASDASRAQTLLQARIAKLESDLAEAQSAPVAPAASRSPEDEAAEVSKMIVLAQRTADAAIADARTTAASMVGDAEQEAGRILATARMEADDSVARHRAALADEIRGLEQGRDQLSADIAALERHVTTQRAVLAASVGRIQSVLDDPASLRVAEGPRLSSDDAPSAPAPSSPAPSSPAPSSPLPGPAPAESAATESAATEPVPSTPAESTPESSSEDEPAPIGSADETPPGADAPTEPTDAPETVVPDVEASDTSSDSDSTAGPHDNLFSRPAANEEPVADAQQTVFDAEAGEAGDGVTFLEATDDESDAAMRRFFEADFDDDTRFGR